jgi:hypothetical protein
MSSTTKPDPRTGRPTGASDIDAAAASTVIAKLRYLLRCQDILEHPAVTCELHKLEEQLTAQLAGAAHASGRHRVTAPLPSAPATLPPAPQALR